MSDPPVREFAASRSRTQHGYLIGGLCALLGLALLFLAGEQIPDRHLLGAVVLALAAGIAWHAWRSGGQAGVHLRIDQNGVALRDWGTRIAWTQIKDIYQSGSRLQPFITLEVRDPEAFLASLPPDEARALRGNRLWRTPELRIPFNAIEAPRDEILEALEAGMAHYR
jgi:hypothetical protein